MTDLYLIAHKVRGEPAFDVAQQIDCPECAAQGCSECDHLGYWWIIPTSGHRAYPFTHWAFNDIELSGYPITYLSNNMDEAATLMPSALPDHYPTRAEPQRSLIDLLGLTTKPQVPSVPIKRRF